MSEVNVYIHLALSALYCLQDKGFNNELADAMQMVLNLNKHIEEVSINDQRRSDWNIDCIKT